MSLSQIAERVMDPLIGHARDAGNVDLELAGLTEADLVRLGWTEVDESLWALFVSDSIFIVRPPGQDDASGGLAVIFLAHKVAHLIAMAMDSGIPLRGAIAYGECFVGTRGQVFLGKPLAEAYLWGERQEWIGAMLAPSAVDALCGTDRNIFRSMPSPDLCEYEIPLKGNVLRPPLCVSIDWRRSGFWGRRPPKITGREPIDVVRKIDNTRAFFETQRSGTPH